MSVKFLDIAFECKMASFQQDAVKTLLCIEEDRTIDIDTVKLFKDDFPLSFREWLSINNPEAIFFSAIPKKNIIVYPDF
jgi:hypothetical protein